MGERPLILDSLAASTGKECERDESLPSFLEVWWRRAFRTPELLDSRVE
jgi:hypothetical protein